MNRCDARLECRTDRACARRATRHRDAARRTLPMPARRCRLRRRLRSPRFLPAAAATVPVRATRHRQLINACGLAVYHIVASIRKDQPGAKFPFTLLGLDASAAGPGQLQPLPDVL